MWAVCGLAAAAAVLLWVVLHVPCMRSGAPPATRPPRRVMILLGLGGHTGEMMRMLPGAGVDRCERVWVVSEGDAMLRARAEAYEQTAPGTPVYVTLPRARRVGEGMVSSAGSTAVSLLAALRLVWRLARAGRLPDTFLTNGPGTSVVIAYALWAGLLMGGSTRIVYVELLARVNRLSLLGMLVLPIATRFLVQWPQLQQRYRGRVEYRGMLV